VGKIESGFVKAIEGTGPAAQEQGTSLVRIASVASAMPEYRFPQGVITAAFKGYWNTKLQEPEKLDWLHSRVGVDFRHLAFPFVAARLERAHCGVDNGYRESLLGCAPDQSNDAATGYQTHTNFWYRMRGWRNWADTGC